MTKIKIKAWGERKLLLYLMNFLDETFLCFTSKLRDSDQGGFHFYADIIINEEWRREPATAKQLLTLQGLGCRIENTITRGEASDLIQDQLNRRAIA